MDSTFKVAVSNLSIRQKLAPGDPLWPKFNASFENKEILAPELASYIFEGNSFTTHHKDHWRTGANYICGQHIGLDFDSGDETSTLDRLAGDKFVERYGSFIYTTISHTPECPRARVVFLLDTPIYQAKNYTLAAAALLWLFGTADRQCKDAVRFFYGSPDCEFRFVDQVLPLDVVRKLITKYQETGLKEKRKADNKDYLPPASQQEVAEALKAIPPWGISYDEWVQVLMGLHAAFGEDGYGLAEAWADGKPGEVDQKWKSFHATGNTAGAVTIATVFMIAKQYGWKKAA